MPTESRLSRLSRHTPATTIYRHKLRGPMQVPPTITNMRIGLAQVDLSRHLPSLGGLIRRPCLDLGSLSSNRRLIFTSTRRYISLGSLGARHQSIHSLSTYQQLCLGNNAGSLRQPPCCSAASADHPLGGRRRIEICTIPAGRARA